MDIKAASLVTILGKVLTRFIHSGRSALSPATGVLNDGANGFTLVREDFIDGNQALGRLADMLSELQEVALILSAETVETPETPETPERSMLDHCLRRYASSSIAAAAPLTRPVSSAYLVWLPHIPAHADLDEATIFDLDQGWTTIWLFAACHLAAATNTELRLERCMEPGWIRISIG